MQGSACAGRRVNIMGHHDNGFTLLLIQGLQQVQDFIPGFAIQVTGRLIAKQQGRVCDDGTCDTGALLFTTG